MVPLLTVISGLAWTIVYFESIRVGFRDRTYAIPIAALALNFAWESTHAAHDLATSVAVQAVVNLIWALADLAIVFTYFKFGPAELPRFVTRTMFAAWGILIFGVCYLVQWLFIARFGWHDASRYTAFLQNALMSGLSVQMLVARRGFRGQPSRLRLQNGLALSPQPFCLGLSKARPSFLALALSVVCSTWSISG